MWCSCCVQQKIKDAYATLVVDVVVVGAAILQGSQGHLQAASKLVYVVSSVELTVVRIHFVFNNKPGSAGS